MYRLKTKTLGDLGEVEPTLPNHMAGGFDFHTAEIVHDSVAGLLVEQFLQLAAANHIVPADLGDREGLIQPLFQIGHYAQKRLV